METGGKDARTGSVIDDRGTNTWSKQAKLITLRYIIAQSCEFKLQSYQKQPKIILQKANQISNRGRSLNFMLNRVFVQHCPVTNAWG
jgi:hypothetical protein